MSTSKLKDDARKHELREEWEKAVQVYLQVLIQAERGEAEVELPLYNRIGDLYIRLNRPQEAVGYYEQAADKYADAGLYNNAIALCNKALRYEPAHLGLLRKLGVFSALQGFHTDARRYFVDYADKQAAHGQGDDALRALEEYHRIAASADSHELYGRRLHEHGRTREGVAQLRAAYEQRAAAGESDRADALRAELLAIDPNLRFHDDPPAAAEVAPPDSSGLAPPPAEPAQNDRFEAESPPPQELAIEHTRFEPPDSSYGMIEVGMVSGDVAEPPSTVSFDALDGLETNAVDLGDATGIADQDLGTGFERDEVSFIAPEPEFEETSDEITELPLLEDPSVPPSLPDIELGLPADAESAGPAYDLTGADPDAPLLDLSSLELGGLLLPDGAAEAAPVELPSLDEVAGDLDLPLVADFDHEVGDIGDGYVQDTLDDTADLIDLNAFSDTNAPTLADELQDQPDEDVREPVLEEIELSGLADVAHDIEVQEEAPEIGFEVFPPIRADDQPLPPAAASFGRALEGWPEDPDDDVAHLSTAADAPHAELPAPASDEVDSISRPQEEVGPDESFDNIAGAGAELDAAVPAAHEVVTARDRESEAAAAEIVSDVAPSPDNDESEPLDDESEPLAAAAADLAPPAMSSGGPARAEQPVAASSPPPPDEGYVDLGALLVDEHEDTTRFRIQETDPSGDEDQDFAELLGRFKEKVAQHLPPEDAAAHYDLGLAFKEMGLIDEAIAEFQVALRTGTARLKVYEEIGQCFLLKEQYNIAEKVLRQALQVEHQHELDLLGIYYQLGRAYEAMNKREQARDAYERVLGMDLNFQDTAARLARL